MKKAEIGTALMIVALVVMSIIGFSSSKFLSKKQTTSTKAAITECEADTNEVSTPIEMCSISSFSGNWNYCVRGSINYVLPNNVYKCSNSNHYADNLNRECYTQECCDESTAGDLGYTYNGNICGKDGNGGQPKDGTTKPAMEAKSHSSSGRDSRCSAYSAGYNNACCVQDTHYCEGKGNIRYRWYGCTGAPCDKTIISTQGGPGHLINCPDGVDSSTNPETGKCKDELPTPTSTPALTSKGSSDSNRPWDGCLNYRNRNECSNACTSEHAGYSCQSSPGTADEKWCCKTKSKPPSGGRTGVNRTGKAGELCIVKQVEPGESTYVYSCINPGYVCSPPNSSGICVTPTSQAGTNSEAGNSATPVPPTTIPTLVISKDCQTGDCTSPNVGVKFYYKCENPLIINREEKCGGSWKYFGLEQACKDGDWGFVYSRDEICNNLARFASFTVTFRLSNLDYESSEPMAHLSIYDNRQTETDGINPSLFGKSINLSEGEASSFTLTNNLASQNLMCTFTYNPRGIFLLRSLPCFINLKDGQGEIIIGSE